MKSVFVGFLLIFILKVNAVTLNDDDSYLGKIDSVAAGFYDQLAITLSEGSTCKGQRVIVLLKSNPDFEQIYPLLLTAVAARLDVHMYRVAAHSVQYGNIEYCIINEAALGRFHLWPVNN